MVLTSSQLTVLKADIIADPALNVFPNNSDGAFAIAVVYNLVASPAFWVWRSSVSRDELVGATSVDGTVFNWTGSGYITRAVGERDAFGAIFDANGN